MRAIGLRYLPPKLLKREWAEEALRVENEGLQREVILSLQSSKAEWRDELLRETASDSQRPVSLRAEAVLGLSSHVDDPLNTHLLLRLIVSENRTLRIESLRALRGRATQNAGVLNALLRQIDNTAPAEEESDAQREFDEQLVLALAGIDDRDRPSLRTLRIRVQRQRPATLEAWQAKLRKGGDAAAGRRVFFHSKSAHCSRWHRADGRGGAIASDLTGAGRAASRRWLIESIVEPGRIIPGPYITWTLITETGKVHSGLVLAEDSDSIVLGTVDGRSTEIRTDAIVSRQPQRKSLMPDNLADQLTSEEFRDLLAFLCRD